jgi:hypothetical protein
MTVKVGTLRGYRDRDFVQTTEGFFFCVYGVVHPEDRVNAYLKYIPDPTGQWGKKGKKFRRILRRYTMPDLLETLNFLEGHPEYLHDSPVTGVKMSTVPLNRISMHFKPEEKMAEILRMKAPDALQRKAANLANYISDESGVPIRYFGVTGSLLLDIHQDFSDIDLIVYGKSNSCLIKETLTCLYRKPGSLIRRFNVEETRRWCLEKAESFPLTYEEALAIFRRKWGRGLFGETMFSVHPVKLEAEVSERYGDRVFRPEGLVKVEAVVSDASEADFLPSIYKVEDVKVTDGHDIEDICEVTSYEGLYGGLAEEGEKIKVYGKLERVTDQRTSREYHHVLVGSREAGGKDYIKPAIENVKTS